MSDLKMYYFKHYEEPMLNLFHNFIGTPREDRTHNQTEDTLEQLFREFLKVVAELRESKTKNQNLNNYFLKNLN